MVSRIVTGFRIDYSADGTTSVQYDNGAVLPTGMQHSDARGTQKVITFTSFQAKKVRFINPHTERDMTGTNAARNFIAGRLEFMVT